jgi:hypothetical protein
MPLNFPVFRIPAEGFSSAAAAQLISEIRSTRKLGDDQLTVEFCLISLPGSGRTSLSDDLITELRQKGYVYKGIEGQGRKSSTFTLTLVEKKTTLDVDAFWEIYTEMAEMAEEFEMQIYCFEPEW